MSYTIIHGLCSLEDVLSELGLDSGDVDTDKISRAIASASRLIESECDRRFWQDPAPRTDSCTLNGTSLVLDASVTATDAGRQVLGDIVPTGSLVTSVTPGVSFLLANFHGTPLAATGSGTEDLTIGLTPRRYVSTSPWLCEVDDISTIDGLVVQSDYAGDGTFGTTWEAGDYQLEPINGLLSGEDWPFTKVRSIRSLYFPIWGGIIYSAAYTQALVQVIARWGWPCVPAPVNEAAIIQAIAHYKASDAPFGATPFPETGIMRLKSALHPTAAMLISHYQEETVLIA